MNCPKCNAENPADVIFCVGCGEPLPPADEEPSKKHSRGLIVGLVILVIVVIVVIGAALLSIR